MGGIQSYSKLKKLTKGSGYQVHHLFEKRFASILGKSKSKMESIVLTKEENAIFTKKWRDLFPYRTKYKKYTNPTKD